jgi:hypothetical protein
MHLFLGHVNGDFHLYMYMGTTGRARLPVLVGHCGLKLIYWQICQTSSTPPTRAHHCTNHIWINSPEPGLEPVARSGNWQDSWGSKKS